MSTRENKPFLLATYGTLKKDFHNHRVIKDCEFIGECNTKSNFTMYSVSNWFPGVVEGGNTSIKIEVFKIEDDVIRAALDSLEGYPNMYDKIIIDTEFGDAIMYIYQYDIRGKEIVKSGNWNL